MAGASLKSRIESILFLSSKPLTLRRLIELTSAKKREITEVLIELQKDTNQVHRGLRVVSQGSAFQMATAPLPKEIAASLVKDETYGEFSKAALETLTIIAYRGPVGKRELELIRGVNCSWILRNLMMRGLIEEMKIRTQTQGVERDSTQYQVTIDFLRFLSVGTLHELPDYDRLHKDTIIEELLHS